MLHLRSLLHDTFDTVFSASRNRERMAELIGIIASLMTIAEGFTGAASLAVDFYMAPKQIEDFEVRFHPWIASSSSYSKFARPESKRFVML